MQSPARYPAMVAAWGTGKSMTAILKIVDLCARYKDNLLAVFRKEYTDLRDSTIKDFESYTGFKVNSSREVTIGTSTVMFRHLEELNNIQNINLGGFWIEQGEELDTDKEFFTLFGRLRRRDCQHVGMVTANVKGRNWIYELWKTGKLENAELIEATTFDNRENLSPEFLDSLEIIRKQRPEIYERFVLNNWDVDEGQFIVIPGKMVRECVDNQILYVLDNKRITVADVAGAGDDETVIYDMENSKILNQEIYSHRSLMDTCGRIQAHQSQHNSNLVCVDKVGEGAGVYDRLVEIYAGTGIKVYGFDGRIAAPEGSGKETFQNYKTYAWFQAREMFFNKTVNIPKDEILIKQLSGVSYEFKSNGKYSLEPKEIMKEKLKCSPDRADAYIMGLDALQYAPSFDGKHRTGGAWLPPRFREMPKAKYHSYA